MSAQNVANVVAHATEQYILGSGKRIVRFTPSIQYNRAYLGFVDNDGTQYAIEILELGKEEE